MKKLLLLISVLFLISCINPPTGGVIETCPEEKALLDVLAITWAANEDNVDEIFFDYYVYNYGDVESKNVVVKCSVYNEDMNLLITSATENIGNIASTSYMFKEMTSDNPGLDPYNDNNLYNLICQVTSCDNCEILNHKIPGLKRETEKYI